MAAPSFRFQAFEENNVLRPLFDSEGKLMFKPMWFLVILSLPEVTKKKKFILTLSMYSCIRERENQLPDISVSELKWCQMYTADSAENMYFDLKSERARVTQAVNN